MPLWGNTPNQTSRHAIDYAMTNSRNALWPSNIRAIVSLGNYNCNECGPVIYIKLNSFACLNDNDANWDYDYSCNCPHISYASKLSCMIKVWLP